MLPALHSTDYSDHPSFKNHPANGPQPFISDLWACYSTGEPFFDMSVRRKYANRDFGRTLSASMAHAADMAVSTIAI